MEWLVILESATSGSWTRAVGVSGECVTTRPPALTPLTRRLPRHVVCWCSSSCSNSYFSCTCLMIDLLSVTQHLSLQLHMQRSLTLAPADVCRMIDLRPCQHDNGYINGRSQIKVHTDERTQVHNAQSSLAVTHPSTNRARRYLTSVTESPSKYWSPPRTSDVCRRELRKHQLKLAYRSWFWTSVGWLMQLCLQMEIKSIYRLLKEGSCLYYTER